MIYCIECVKNNWEHQEVNSGIIKQIAKVNLDEDILVIAGAGHNSDLRNYCYPANVNFRDYDFGEEFTISNDTTIVVDKYKSEIEKLFSKEEVKKGDKIFFLFSDRNLIGAMKYIGLLYFDVKFFCIIHANLEKIYPGGMQTESNTVYKIQTAVNSLSELPNVHIVTYSPDVKEKMAPYINKNVVDRMYFINLPTSNDMPLARHKKCKKIHIGIWGASANTSAIKIVKQVIQNTDSTNFDIIILNRGHSRETIMDPRVHVFSKVDGFHMEEIRKLLQKCDWVLIPYDRFKYQVSASGILADAIRYEIPVFALDSPFIVYYHSQAAIGYVMQSENELAEKIIDVIEGRQDERAQFVNNLCMLKEKLELENHKKFFEMIYNKEKDHSLEDIKLILSELRSDKITLLNSREKGMSIDNVQKKRADNLKKIILIMNQLFMASQEGKKIGEYLLGQGYNTVSIYGMGFLGQRLYMELCNSGIKVLCGIDRKGQEATTLIKVVTIEEFSYNPDLIIVSTASDFMQIERKILQYVQCKILSIEDILNAV